MTLHEIAADLRGVAGMLCGGHAQAGLYRLEFALVADIDAEACLTQVLDPLGAAHATGALVHHHPRQRRGRGRNILCGRFWRARTRSEEHTSELQSLMRISYAVFCLKKKKEYNCTHNDK